MKTRRTASFALALVLFASVTGMAACAKPLQTKAPAAGQVAASAAHTQLGRPYVNGGSSPASGFDCSGLTYWAWQQAHVALPRTAAAQYAWTTRIHQADLQPGDLVFYSSAGPTGAVSHVAIYAGRGYIIQAHHYGVPLSEDVMVGWWAGHLVGFGRIPASAIP